MWPNDCTIFQSREGASRYPLHRNHFGAQSSQGADWEVHIVGVHWEMESVRFENLEVLTVGEDVCWVPLLTLKCGRWLKRRDMSDRLGTRSHLGTLVQRV